MYRKLQLIAIASLVAVAGLVTISVAKAGSKTIELPLDGVQLKPSTLPGCAKAQAISLACHSAEYMQYQPTTAARPYWDAMAKRMVFKAPIADEDIPLVVEYLAKTYGNEHPK